MPGMLLSLSPVSSAEAVTKPAKLTSPICTERRPSPGLSLELNSKNPFRNRAASPNLPSPNLQTPTSAGSRPMSRNPFLQTFEAEFNKEAQLIDMSATMKESPKKTTFGDDARELFVRPRPLSQCRSTALYHQPHHSIFFRSRTPIRHVSQHRSARWVISDVLRACLLTILPYGRTISH